MRVSITERIISVSKLILELLSAFHAYPQSKIRSPINCHVKVEKFAGCSRIIDRRQQIRNSNGDIVSFISSLKKGADNRHGGRDKQSKWSQIVFLFLQKSLFIFFPQTFVRAVCESFNLDYLSARINFLVITSVNYHPDHLLSALKHRRKKSHTLTNWWSSMYK